MVRAGLVLDLVGWPLTAGVILVIADRIWGVLGP
jgi:hypothetical protein